jgi:hypothetical protein
MNVEDLGVVVREDTPVRSQYLRLYVVIQIAHEKRYQLATFVHERECEVRLVVVAEVVFDELHDVKRSHRRTRDLLPAPTGLFAFPSAGLLIPRHGEEFAETTLVVVGLEVVVGPRTLRRMFKMRVYVLPCARSNPVSFAKPTRDASSKSGFKVKSLRPGKSLLIRRSMGSCTSQGTRYKCCKIGVLVVMMVCQVLLTRTNDVRSVRWSTWTRMSSRSSTMATACVPGVSGMGAISRELL